jgi:aryl-alcohol dehydrogenase-like predicted oxidoreductase
MTMEQRRASKTDLNLSILGLGTMTMGWSSDKPTSFAVMDAALEAGINFFDSADIYSNWVPGNPGGVSEEWIGDWLKDRGTRDQVIVATKVRGRMWNGPDGEGLSRAHIMRAVEDSLRRLKCDHIDLYQTHWADEEVPYEETMRAFDDLVQQGKVRYIGCSNHSPQQLRDSLAASAQHNLTRYETLQPHYNLVHRQEFEAELRDICRREQLGVIPYSPLAGGFLTGKYQRGQKAPQGSRGAGNSRMEKYSNEAGFSVIDALAQLAEAHNATPSQVAIAWLIANTVVTSAIIGARTVDQLKETIKSAAIQLTAEEIAQLNQVSDRMPA